MTEKEQTVRYRETQLNKITIPVIGNVSLKITQEGEQTNWLDISEYEFRKIRMILTRQAR